MGTGEGLLQGRLRATSTAAGTYRAVPNTCTPPPSVCWLPSSANTAVIRGQQPCKRSATLLQARQALVHVLDTWRGGRRRAASGPPPLGPTLLTHLPAAAAGSERDPGRVQMRTRGCLPLPSPRRRGGRAAAWRARYRERAEPYCLARSLHGDYGRTGVDGALQAAGRRQHADRRACWGRRYLQTSWTRGVTKARQCKGGSHFGGAVHRYATLWCRLPRCLT